MEVDTIINTGDIVAESTSVVARSPLALDLSKRCSILLENFGITSHDRTLRLPFDLPQVVVDYAFKSSSSGSASELLEALSKLVAEDGMAVPVFQAFGPIVLDLLARWLEDAQPAGIDVLESRLVSLASLASPRPDLWRYVNSIGSSPSPC
jgi:midasin